MPLLVVATNARLADEARLCSDLTDAVAQIASVRGVEVACV